MREASPRPGRLGDSEPAVVLDAEGRAVRTPGNWADQGRAEADAALIVAAVNGLRILRSW